MNLIWVEVLREIDFSRKFFLRNGWQQVLTAMKEWEKWMNSISKKALWLFLDVYLLVQLKLKFQIHQVKNTRNLVKDWKSKQIRKKATKTQLKTVSSVEIMKQIIRDRNPAKAVLTNKKEITELLVAKEFSKIS